MKYLVVSDRAHVDAFKLIGLEGVCVSTEQEGDEALDSALRSWAGTVILDSRIYDRNVEKITAHERTGGYPVVMRLAVSPLPSPGSSQGSSQP